MPDSIPARLQRLAAEEAAKALRRKCFVSHYAADRVEVDQFLGDFGDVFIPQVIGVTNGDHFIGSEDSDYVASQIRDKYLGDSTVTLCLIGACTHSRRFVDWELMATLQNGSHVPNGLVGIVLPSLGTSAHLPPRFKDNWNSDESRGYAIFRPYPSTKEALRDWIKDAFARRTSKAHLIRNSQAMHKYNRICLAHNKMHK